MGDGSSAGAFLSLSRLRGLIPVPLASQSSLLIPIRGTPMLGVSSLAIRPPPAPLCSDWNHGSSVSQLLLLAAVTLPSGVKGEADEDGAILLMAREMASGTHSCALLILRPVAVSSSSPHRRFFPHRRQQEGAILNFFQFALSL